MKGVGEKLSGAADAAGEAVDDVKTGVGKVGDMNFLDEITNLKETLANKAAAFADEKKKMFEDFKNEKINLLKNYIQTRLEGIFDHVMNAGAEGMKEGIKDPYMPMCIQKLVDDAVDGNMPDIKMEVKETILAGLSETREYAHGEPPGCCGAIRAWFRYALLPYDRSIWRIMRHPLFWLWTIATIFPKYGVMIMAYFLYFLMIDKEDEFQLFVFITDFKSLQFLTIGILSSMIGAVQYYLCVTTSPTNCKEYAPREDIWTMIFFILQVFMVWAAFILMGSSKKKGGFHFQYEQGAKDQIKASVNTKAGVQSGLAAATAADDSDDEGHADKAMAAIRFETEGDMLETSRARLRLFLMWVLCVFIFCLALVLFVAFANFLDEDTNVEPEDTDTYNNSNWKFTMALYWIKALYGLLSFPFISLKLPVVKDLITHAKPTGYNPYGVCVPYVKVEEEVNVPWDTSRAATKAAEKEAEEKENEGQA
jgi:hypothetical protein